ncbi:MAG: hypothetical protein QGG36_28170 [Pirellulaceae bacterium]|jgi:hypothetical protein|nr:hypothetical protein [Pirellulaceae bacterium]MDP7019706.1 hypothetical protein [Pirellulaceae bacterium]
MDCEHATSRALFGELAPFAATRVDMCLDRAYVDLFCFDYRNRRRSPAVILWLADRANEAYLEWEHQPLDEDDDDDELAGVRWDEFAIPVADSCGVEDAGLPWLDSSDQRERTKSNRAAARFVSGTATFADFVKMLRPA